MATGTRPRSSASANGHYYPEDNVFTLPSLRLVQPPQQARRIAKLLGVMFLLTPIALVFVPWQQYVTGSGTVVALDPVDRPQEIDAPIAGRINKWYVIEGSRVKLGDPIVQIIDNDPNFLPRLRTQREAISTKLDAYQQKAELVDIEVRLLGEARDQAIEAADNHVKMAVAKVEQAEAYIRESEARLQRDTLNLNRMRQLERDGLAATQERELAERDYLQSRAALDTARAALVSAQKEVEARQADLERVTPSEDAKIQKALGEQAAARGEVESTRKELTALESQIDRQLTQDVTATADGIIFRILANKTLNGQVSAGEPLVLLVPEVESRVTEIFVAGNDAPLIQKGDFVRLQFEGWPAVQFVGWPSVAVGTFGGRVLLVDATSSDIGKFRVLVEPFVGQGDQPWPSNYWLRQGVRAKGWVLLNRVTLGYEVWRRLNGFPPVVAGQEPDSDEKVKVKRPK